MPSSRDLGYCEECDATGPDDVPSSGPTRNPARLISCEEYDYRGRSPNGLTMDSYDHTPGEHFYRMGVGGRFIIDSTDDERGVNDPYFGLELEVEVGRAERQTGLNIIGEAMPGIWAAKYDGSLSYGVEFVSQPMTLEVAQSLPWTAFETLVTYGWRAWDTSTAGMHIHISRVAFQRPISFLSKAVYTVPIVGDGDSHLYKFGHLIYRNERFWKRFSGRSSRQWANFTGERRAFGHRVKRTACNPRYGNRYVPVNTNNDRTVEIRMFRGSLIGDRVLTNLEGMAAAVAYTRNLTIGQVAAGGLLIQPYLDYVREHEAMYPHVAAYLDSPRFAASIAETSE